MIELTNFTLKGHYCTAVFVLDREDYNWVAHVDQNTASELCAPCPQTLFGLSAMGKELAEMSVAAERIIKASSGLEVKNEAEDF